MHFDCIKNQDDRHSRVKLMFCATVQTIFSPYGFEFLQSQKLMALLMFSYLVCICEQHVFSEGKINQSRPSLHAGK